MIIAAMNKLVHKRKEPLGVDLTYLRNAVPSTKRVTFITSNCGSLLRHVIGCRGKVLCNYCVGLSIDDLLELAAASSCFIHTVRLVRWRSLLAGLQYVVPIKQVLGNCLMEYLMGLINQPLYFASMLPFSIFRLL
jgi:hypothetical protein